MLCSSYSTLLWKLAERKQALFTFILNGKEKNPQSEREKEREREREKRM